MRSLLRALEPLAVAICSLLCMCAMLVHNVVLTAITAAVVGFAWGNLYGWYRGAKYGIDQMAKGIGEVVQ